MRNRPLSDVYKLLEPGPVVLLTTAHHGRADVMAMSWRMMVDFEPPLIACIVSDRDHSCVALRATRQCVIAIPPVELAATVVAVGNCSGRDVDKFDQFPLTARKASLVAAPLIAECFANLECRVVDLVERYGMFMLEAVKAWIDPARRNAKTIHHRGYGEFVVDGETIRLPSKMP